MGYDFLRSDDENLAKDLNGLNDAEFFVLIQEGSKESK